MYILFKKSLEMETTNRQLYISIILKQIFVFVSLINVITELLRSGQNRQKKTSLEECVFV